MYGNNGSVDGDLFVVMCYIEVCFFFILVEFLCDIEKEIVDFIFNFDDIFSELIVLLVCFLNFLVNGFIGIFVGYVIDILLYNLIEIIEVVIKWLDNLFFIMDDIMKIVKGLDFLIGGII